MNEERKIMIYLKIENNKGYFVRPKEDTSELVEIDKINKEDLMYLLNQLTTSDFEMDAYDESKMANKAHQIIYKNIFEKFETLITTKSKFKDESESFYKDAFEKYSAD